MTRSTRRQILIIEDNPGDLVLIREALRMHSLECTLLHYANASDALRAIANCGDGDTAVPDLIMIDYNLPGGDARDILTAAAKNPNLASVPRAVVTSSVAPSDRIKVMQLGAHFIHKPCDFDEFMAAVGNGIRSLLANEGTASQGSCP
jgi:two-component system response regulator